MNEKAEKRGLKLNTYEYFEYCDHQRNIRAVAVITDKQCIFYSQIQKNDFRTHDNIVVDIENTIHPNAQKKGWDAYYKNHAYVASVGKDLIISMPENGELSLAQAKFICDILDQTNQYMNEEENNYHKIKIDFFDTPEHESEFDVTDIESLKKKIQERVTPNITIEEEKIIGTTLSKEEIKNNLLKHLDLKECFNINDIIGVLKQCSMYYHDSYYKDIFCDIFPDYIEVKELIELLSSINFKSEKLENITLKNIKNVIYESVNSIFKDKNTYEEIQQVFLTIYFLNISEEQKQKMFPNLNLVSKLFNKLHLSDEEQKQSINNLLEKASTYEEVAKVVCNLAYHNRNNELEKLQHSLTTANNSLEKIQIENNIISSKDILNEMIDRKKELNAKIQNHTSKIIENEVLIEFEEQNQNNKNKIIQTSSSNLLKRIINKRKIKEYTNELNSSKLKSQNLKNEREECLKQIDELKKEIQSIEKKFKDITHFDYFPFDKSSMEIHYKKDNHNYKNYIISNIEFLKQEIANLKNELIQIYESGYLVINNNDIENVEENHISNSNNRHR